MNTLLEALSLQTAAWIRAQRNTHLAVARALSSQERAALAQHVDADLLEAARISTVREMENPPFLSEALATLRRMGIAPSFDFHSAAGITFDCCILVREGMLGPALLLHELVHAEQYRRLGIDGFARGYVNGLARASFVYEANSFEAVAFQLESRFGHGEAFRMAHEVDAWLARQPAA